MKQAELKKEEDMMHISVLPVPLGTAAYETTVLPVLNTILFPT